jgi:serine/threonine-protein phosphatase 5
MLNLFSLTGEPTENHYLLMNGDLVDRGSWSMEVILTAFAFKCSVVTSTHPNKADFLLGLYPNYMYINRGNHEAKEMNRTYGFQDEATHKYGEQAYKVCLLPFILSPELTPC